MTAREELPEGWAIERRQFGEKWLRWPIGAIADRFLPNADTAMIVAAAWGIVDADRSGPMQSERQKLVAAIEELNRVSQNMHTIYQNDRHPNRASAMEAEYRKAALIADPIISRYAPEYGRLPRSKKDAEKDAADGR